MASDISRKTFNPQKHYSGVIMQQGRVQLDADWNEQLDIQQHRTHTETRDVIGESGVPQNFNRGDSFKIISSKGDLIIAPGRIYVGGLLCELEQQIRTKAPSYLNQPYYPNPVAIPASGTYIVYIDAWQREVNYLDDPLIQEVAFGGADTTTRRQTVWQVKLLSVSNLHGNCDSVFEEWGNLTEPKPETVGTLNVRTVVESDENPCLIPPKKAYTRLENQLYRVEVHSSGNLGQATFKWSRDNATVETSIESVNGSKLILADLGRDEVLGFGNGQWVEIIDEESALKNQPHPLYKIKSLDLISREIELDTTPPLLNANKLKKLRRWDQSVPAAGANGLPTTTGSIKLEEGIEVEFSNGTYRAGDYWLIPARTATGEVEWPPYEIPNTDPLPQRPHGVKHAYCKLAIIKVASGVATVQDCRPLFPALTDLDDLRLHNKYLHGSGVICGLKVKCGLNRHFVTIESGNALDCKGHMIRVIQEINYNIVETAITRNFLDYDAENDTYNGKVYISIARGVNGSATLNIEPFGQQGDWDRILEGTLLKDFYDHCIKGLIDLFKASFPIPYHEIADIHISEGNGRLVSEPYRRCTAFINILAQMLNSASGSYAFISGGSQTPGDLPDEDALLHSFYDALKEKLASETYCGMYDGDTTFPDYDIEPGLGTIFGPPLKTHHKLRLHPNGRFAYTCGQNNKIYVYEVSEERQELIEITSFPQTGTNVQIQDIAIQEDDLYAVGWEGNNSWFAKATIDHDTGLLTWGDASPSSNAGMQYVSLGIGPNNKVFAIAKSHGLYSISGIDMRVLQETTVSRSFSATGLLHIAPNNYAIAAHSIGTVPAGYFSHIRIINLFPQQGEDDFLDIPIAGLDACNDILVLDKLIFVTGNDQINSILNVYDFLGNPFNNQQITLANKTYVRMAISTGDIRYLLLTLSDQGKVIRIPLTWPLDNIQIDETFRIPTQIFPIDIVVDNTNTAYVLNTLVNTLTKVNLNVLNNRPLYTFEPPHDARYNQLAVYRAGVYQAYYDLLTHVLQSLKDCFCDKFLIDCPDCKDDDKVYLACVEIKEGKVHHICNFSKRKYSKSFKTVEYWLSTVPILPIIKDALSKFCCMVIERSEK